MRFKMKTLFPNENAINHDWLLVDAQGKSLGRLATQVAKLLRGKNKASYSPHVFAGDHVIVINAKKVVLTGNKNQDKTYYRHTGYPGGIRSTKAWEVRNKHPERLIEKAVKGMLPKGPLGNKLFRKMKVYADDKHNHEAQMPKPYDITRKAS